MVPCFSAFCRNHLIVKTFLHGGLARSARLKRDSQEKSQAKPVNLSRTTINVSQKIWNWKDRKIYSDVDQDLDDVDASCAELDQKITEANQAQLLGSTLIQEKTTLRYDTNALLDAQLIPRPPPSEGFKTEKSYYSQKWRLALTYSAPPTIAISGKSSRSQGWNLIPLACCEVPL